VGFNLQVVDCSISFKLDIFVKNSGILPCFSANYGKVSVNTTI
jgi:hypothetical protein